MSQTLPVLGMMVPEFPLERVRVFRLGHGQLVAGIIIKTTL